MLISIMNERLLWRCVVYCLSMRIHLVVFLASDMIVKQIQIGTSGIYIYIYPYMYNLR